MNQTTEAAAETPIASEPPLRQEGLGQVGKAAAWVGIVAGVVFIVGMIFAAGFWLGSSPDGYGGGHFGRAPGHMMSGDGSNSCPMMGSGPMKPPGGPNATPAPGAPHHNGWRAQVCLAFGPARLVASNCQVGRRPKDTSQW